MLPPLNRRALLHQGGLYLAALGLNQTLHAQTAAPLLRIGMMTDLHYADKPPTKTRFYREALGKLDEAVEHFNREKPTFVIELGDLIDQADSVETETTWLQTIEKRYSRLAMPRHYVLGNHCVTTLTKREFAQHTGASAQPHYSWEVQGITFVVLDACYRDDGIAYERNNFTWQNSFIPEAEQRWLETTLQEAKGPVVVFAHQRLDNDAHHAIRNAPAIRAILEKSRKVTAVFQGHSHKNDYQHINGIHFTTLVAMIEGTGAENNGYTLLDVFSDGALHLHGFRRQQERALPLT